MSWGPKWRNAQICSQRSPMMENVEKEKEGNLNRRRRQLFLFPSVDSKTREAAALQVAVNRAMCLSVAAHSTPKFEETEHFE